MKVVFFDRDGTLIVEPDDERVNSVDKILLFPDTIEALKLLYDSGYSIIIITNQAGIAEGSLSEEEFWDLNSVVLDKILFSGIKVLKTYMNGDGKGSKSEWRKPAPGMLLQAAKDFNLNLSEIYMVGDRQTDIDAGLNAGCKGGILVKTDFNHIQASSNAKYNSDSLINAARYILNN